jgi:putative endonuclease
MKRFQIKNKKPFNLPLGERGEMAAASFLSRNGYQILERNYRCALGEIDIVARRKKRVAFVEIKTRQDHAFGSPQEAVHLVKQKKLVKLAQCYLKEKKLLDCAVSFDVLAITWALPLDPVFYLIQDAFEVPAEKMYSS